MQDRFQPAPAAQAGAGESESCAPRRRSLGLRAGLSIVGAAAVTVALGVELSGRREQFVTALHAVPLATLVLVIVLQVGALLARSEAWYVCVGAAGGTVSRRLLFRAAGLGYLASVLNGSLGLAARLTCLRRVAPDTTPKVPALLAAEVPIIAVEVALAAIFSFTLIAPLGVPWWVPVLAIAAMVAARERRSSASRIVASSVCGPGWP